MFGVADMVMSGCSEFSLFSLSSVIWRFPIGSPLMMSSGVSDSADSDSSVDSSIPSLSSSSEDSVLPSSSDSTSCPSRGSSRSSSSWSLSGGGSDSRQMCSPFSVVVKLQARF